VAEGGDYEGIKYGHVFAGIEYPAIESRGTIVLLLEQEISDGLSVEVAQLELDLICDGWMVRRLDVDKGDDVTEVKQLILDLSYEDPFLEAIFILGHVPVPYSGDVMSAHSDHCGAYPADIYYGELDGNWTDHLVNDNSATRRANHNVPQDGKFDQTLLPSDVDLQVGRVDLSSLPVFDQDELELTRLYLQKNHDYRTGKISLGRRGLIDNNVGDMDGMAVGAIGYRNFASMFGAQNVKEADYFGTMDKIGYLWSQGCGPSSYVFCAGVGSSGDFATKKVHSVFTMLYGSYFGDWDSENNLLRAALASKPSLLASMWAGAPAWHLHHMALGETIGYSTRISQNNSTLYAPSDRVRQIHVALMGDPTLRLHVVKPPQNLTTSKSGNNIQLNWSPSDDDILGYHIYRADSLRGKYVRLNSDIIDDTEFLDNVNIGDSYAYMVRAVKLESSGGGTYYNLSQGILDSASNSIALLESIKQVSLNCYPNPMNESTEIAISSPRDIIVNIDLIDMRGKVVKPVFSGDLSQGKNTFYLNVEELSAGIYLLRCVTSQQKPIYERIVLSK